MLSALDVARFFVSRAADPQTENDLSNLKLQKLCYYAAGYFLAVFGKRLFREPVESWPQGPVVAAVYHAYKQNGDRPIQLPEGGHDIDDDQVTDLLNSVYEYFGQFSAWTLRNKTHNEPPWMEARPTQSDLSDDTMRTFFRGQLEVLDNPEASEKELLRQMHEANRALVEGTRRGRADVIAGRYSRLER